MIEKILKEILKEIKKLDNDSKIEEINKIKLALHEISPMKNEPVDCVLWVKNDSVYANDYNPNKVAPPEMELLRTSINHDGYTQPIVTMPDDKGKREVIDGFHRNRVGKECKDIQARVNGYLPVVSIRSSQKNRNDRIASTIRHNRARGKHQVDAMSEIVIELKNRNWKNSRISKELGMDEDEILRLCQITGLQELFSDDDFSNSWDIGNSSDDFEEITDNEDLSDFKEFRTTNTSDPDRIFHTFDKWECQKAGFYNGSKKDMSKNECIEGFKNFFLEDGLFEKVLKNLIVEWKNSCEHYLTNKSMNRIAWLGQASVCYHTGIPSKFSSAYTLLSSNDQKKNNKIALKYLNIWLIENGLKKVSLEEALSIGRQIEIY